MKLFALAVLLCADCAAITFAHAQATAHALGNPANNTINAVLTSNPATGDVVAVQISIEHGISITSVVDANSNAYAATASSPSHTNAAAGAKDTSVYYLIAGATALKTITVNWSGLKNVEVWVDDFTVTGGTAALDTDAAGTGSVNGNTSSPVIAPSASGELLVAVVGFDNGTASGAQSPWTENSVGSGSRADAGYVLSSSGSVTVSFAVSFATAGYSTIAAAFKSAGGTAYTKTTQDALLTSDAVLRGIGRFASDKLPAADLIVVSVGRVVSRSETIYGLASVSTLANHFASQAEALKLADSQTGLGAHFATLTERVPAADPLTHQIALSLLSADRIGMSDAAAGLGAHFAARTDVLTRVDTGTGAAAHFALPTEVLMRIDTGTGLGAHFAIPTDVLKAIDAGTRLASLHVGTFDLLLLSDLGTRSHSQFVVVSEAFGLIDASSRSAAHFAVVTDRWSPLDTPTAAAGHFLSVSDVMTLTEARLQSAAHFATVSDRWSPVDAPSGTAAHFLAAREVAGVTDSQRRLLGRFTSEASYARESASGLGAHFARPVELALLRDFSVSSGGTHNFTVTYIEGLPFHETGTVFVAPFVLPAHRGVYLIKGVSGTYIAVPRIGVMQ